MGVADIGAGVVGVGFIGVAHVEALRRLGVHVAGVVGSSPARARAKAATTNLPPVYEDYEQLLPDDVVHVTGPFRALFAAVYADIEQGGPSSRPAYPTFADGHDAVCVTEAVARSADEQRWVSVNR